MGYRFPWVSVIALVGANLIPLLGVVFLGWRIFPILLLYSLENIVVGFYNVLRMIAAPCDLEELERTSQGVHGKVGLIVFFCVHYGGFVAGHLFFIIVLFGFGHITDMLPGSSGPQASSPRPVDSLQIPWIGLAAASLLVSHGVSYVKNFIGAGEYTRVTANKLFMRPYGRILVLHVTIVLGAFTVLWTGSRLAPLMLFVAGKIIVDLVGHVSERKKFQGSGANLKQPERKKLISDY